MRALALRRLPPGGSPIRGEELRRLLGLRAPAVALRGGLEEHLGTAVGLRVSGRDAMRVALGELARETGRDEVIVPAFTCFSVPAAAVAAGLRVRLVDVTERGALDPTALEALPLERAAAVVVSNLFGVPEPVGPIRDRVEPAGVRVVDDAAQALGATGPEGPVGSRGARGILSFGRGKPLEALGGGALVGGGSPGAPETVEPGDAGRLPALLAALGYRLATSGALYGWIASIPALGVGRTVFDPGFPQGEIRARCAALGAARLPDLEAHRAERAREAERIASAVAGRPGLRPLLAPSGWTGAYPRLAIRVADADTRERVLAALEPLGAGAGRLYPTSLARVAALAPHRVEASECPGAEALCDGLFTLPTHGRWHAEQRERIVEVLHRTA